MATTKYGSTWTGTYSGAANRYFRAYCTYTTSETDTNFTVSVSALGIEKTSGGECVMSDGTSKKAKLSINVSSGTNMGSVYLEKSTTKEKSWSSGSQKWSLGSGSLTIPKGTASKSYTCTLTASKSGGDTSTAWGGKSSGTFSITVPAKKVTVSYSANGGSGAPASTKVLSGTKVTLSTTKPTRSGYRFMGWGTSSGATSTVTSITPTANTTVYAVWKQIFTLSYNANGGANAPAAQSGINTESAKIPTTKPTRTGYDFLGWSTSSTATAADPTYDPGESVTLSANRTLYAVWHVSYVPPQVSEARAYRVSAASGGVNPEAQTSTALCYADCVINPPTSGTINSVSFIFTKDGETSGTKVTAQQGSGRYFAYAGAAFQLAANESATVTIEVATTPYNAAAETLKDATYIAKEIYIFDAYSKNGVQSFAVGGIADENESRFDSRLPFCITDSELEDALTTLGWTECIESR